MPSFRLVEGVGVKLDWGMRANWPIIQYYAVSRGSGEVNEPAFGGALAADSA